MVRTPSMILAVGLLLLLALPATADPSSVGALPPARSTTSNFGFSGARPVSRLSPTGIVRPTTPPRLRGSMFGAAAPRAPRAPRLAVTRPVRAVTRAPCTTVVCAPPALTTTTTRRDKLSVPTAFWSSGYHDGKERYTTRTVRSVDPCTGTCTTTVYPPPAEPCVVRRPAPVYCAPRVRFVAPYYPVYGPPVGYGWGWGWGWGGGWGGWGGCW